GDFPASRNRTTQTGDFLVHNSSLPARLFLLGFFDDDAFIGVTHALALVGFGFAICTNFSSHLANDLLVGALDDDLGLSGALDLDASRHAVNDVVRKTKLQLQCLALNLSAETHADQVKTTLEAFADARYHVGNQCAQCARHGLGLAGIVGNSKCQLTVFLTNDDVASQVLCQRAQRTFNGNLTCADRGFYALGYGDRVLSNT